MPINRLRAAIILTLVVAVLLAAWLLSGVRGPGAYVDIRDPKNVKIIVLDTDGQRTILMGTLSPLTWDGFLCFSTLTCGSIIVQTSQCKTMIFNKFKSGIYCISCREGNIQREHLGKECPLQSIPLASNWASYDWKILD